MYGDPLGVRAVSYSVWLRDRDSHPGPSAYEADALTTALPRWWDYQPVGIALSMLTIRIPASG